MQTINLDKADLIFGGPSRSPAAWRNPRSTSFVRTFLWLNVISVQPASRSRRIRLPGTRVGSFGVRDRNPQHSERRISDHQPSQAAARRRPGTWIPGSGKSAAPRALWPGIPAKTERSGIAWSTKRISSPLAGTSLLTRPQTHCYALPDSCIVNARLRIGRTS